MNSISSFHIVAKDASYYKRKKIENMLITGGCVTHFNKEMSLFAMLTKKSATTHFTHIYLRL